VAVGRPKGERRLTRERIVEVALDLIDRAGLDGLSMRKLGTELGVDPMSIYHHLPNKDALLRAVVQSVFAGMRTPPPRGQWTRRVHQWANAYRALALAHPNLVLRIVADPATVAVAAVQVNESLYAALDASGLPPKTIVRAADVIVDFVNGYVLAESAPGFSDGHAARRALQAELDSRPTEQVAVQRRLLGRPSTSESQDSFKFGIDLILAGIRSTTGGTTD
jgi:TetR/AcrR family tetracycline transcriptional repressor